MPGLTEKGTESAKDLLNIMDEANANRTTHATTANDTSSRSHAICQVLLGGCRYLSGRRGVRSISVSWSWWIWLAVRGRRIRRVTIDRGELRGQRSIRGSD